MASHMHAQDSVPDIDSQNAEGQDDIGYYAPIGGDEKAPVVADDSEPIVYGLDNLVDGGVNPSQNRRWQNILVAGITAIFAALVISHFVFGFPSLQQIGSSSQDEQEVDSGQSASSQDDSKADKTTSKATAGEDTTEKEQKQEEQPPADLTQEELTSQACNLTFDGADLSVPVEEVVVEVKRGNVQVSHTPSGPVSDGTLITRNAAQQAAALCNGLNDQLVQGDSEDAASPFTGVTWIVLNESGEAYLAVRFNADSAPTTGDGITVLTQAAAYSLSGSVYYAMGQVVPQTAGSAITSVSGEEIVPAAEIMY